MFVRAVESVRRPERLSGEPARLPTEETVCRLAAVANPPSQ